VSAGRWLAALPDVPRWVEARAMLEGGGWIEPCGPDGAVVGDDGARLIAALGDARGDDVAAIADVRGAGWTVLAAIERGDVADALRARGWIVERAVLHELAPGAEDTLPDHEGVAVLPDDAPLPGVPEALAAEIAHARRSGRRVLAAWVDCAPVTFAYAPWRTTRWFDVSIDTVPAARGLGLATRAAAALIRVERADGRAAVWGAAESNAPSLRLAARLGFVATDALWVASAS
jgi:hypothetical protein